MTELTRKHIVGELFGYAAAHYDGADSDEQNAMANVLNRAAQMLEEEGGATEKIETLTTENSIFRTKIEGMEKYVQELEGKIAKFIYEENPDNATDSGSPIPTSCEWFDDDDGWHSSCGKNWEFTYDGPKENGLDFCMKCGKPVTIAEFVDGRHEP